jgi:phenylalanyl-tRNA synthetase alpha subunit
MEHSRLTVQIVEDAQRPAEAGWAFGLGLERLAMVRTDPSIAA